MARTTLTHAQLRISPYNVRTYAPDAEDTATLEASILEEGQINAIDCHPLEGKRRPGRELWGAVAGGRRYRAFGNLIARGDLPADHPIDVDIHEGLTEAELIELSITENLIRKNLRDHELYAGVARAAANGHDIGRIAAGLGGQDVAKVARWLRLGSLAKPVFDALASGTIDVDRAKAYAATEDHALQARVFAELPATASPSQIRKAMKVGDAEAARMLAFVGTDAYRDAGGRFELDLFADDDAMRGRVEDEGLLRELVEARMETLRGETRVTCQHRDLRFVAEPPANGYGGRDYTLQVIPVASRTGGADYRTDLPEGDIVAHIAIGDEGRAEITYWWASRSAKHGSGAKAGSSAGAKPSPARQSLARMLAAKPGTAIAQNYDGTRQLADAMIKEEAGLTQDLVQIFRSLRRAILRAMLIDEAHQALPHQKTVALDYLIWSQLRLALCADSSAAIGIGRIVQPEEFAAARPHIDAAPAGKHWSAAIRDVCRESFMTTDDPAAAFRAYRAAPVAIKNLATAIVAGLALERSLDADGYRIPVHDALAHEIDMAPDLAARAWCPPTAELIGALPKAAQLEIAEPFVEAVHFAGWSRLKMADLTRNVLQVVTGTHGALRRTLHIAVTQWAHPLLRFAPPPRAGETADQPREMEAAEWPAR